jgi:hypothetical protein
MARNYHLAKSVDGKQYVCRLENREIAFIIVVATA